MVNVRHFLSWDSIDDVCLKLQLSKLLKSKKIYNSKIDMPISDARGDYPSKLVEIYYA